MKSTIPLPGVLTLFGLAARANAHGRLGKSSTGDGLSAPSGWARRRRREPHVFWSWIDVMPNDSLATRASLLLQLRNRDDSLSWSRFARIYTPLIDHWISRFGFPEADRSDLVQEVFLVLLGKISSFQYNADQSFRGWLRTITVNKCRDFARRSKRKTEPQLMELIEKATVDDTELLTEQEYREFVSREALRWMREHFSDTTWRACWEHVAHGRPAREVAEELGISENAVYLARGRVLSRLRQELDGLWE